MDPTLYCEISDISALSRIEFNENTSFTEDQVTELITQESAYIDGVLAKKYITPITGDKSLILVKKVCIQLVVKRIDPALNTTISADIIRVKLGEAFDPDATLRKIIAGEIELMDAQQVDSPSGSFKIIHNFDDRQFRNNTDQW